MKLKLIFIMLVLTIYVWANDSSYVVIFAGGKTEADALNAIKKWWNSEAKKELPEIRPVALLSDTIEGLNPGFHIAVAGTYEEKSEAEKIKNKVNVFFKGAYIRRVYCKSIELYKKIDKSFKLKFLNDLIYRANYWYIYPSNRKMDPKDKIDNYYYSNLRGKDFAISSLDSSFLYFQGDSAKKEFANKYDSNYKLQNIGYYIDYDLEEFPNKNRDNTWFTTKLGERTYFEVTKKSSKDSYDHIREGEFGWDVEKYLSITMKIYHEDVILDTSKINIDSSNYACELDFDIQFEMINIDDKNILLCVYTVSPQYFKYLKKGNYLYHIRNGKNGSIRNICEDFYKYHFTNDKGKISLCVNNDAKYIWNGTYFKVEK